MFNKCSRGLYYYDMKNMEHEIIYIQVTDSTFMNTLDRKKAYLTRHEIKWDYEARISQQLVGCPSTQTLKEAIKNEIRSWPITIDHINRADAIYVPQIPILQGKDIRSMPEHYKTTPRIPLHPNIAKATTLWKYIWIFLCKYNPFPKNKTKEIYFRSVQAYNSRVKSDIISGLKK